jgi:hypothetical protein
MRKRSSAAFLAATITLGSAIFVASPAHALNSAESSFLSLTNRERTSRGIASLSIASDLTAVARQHSARMARDGKIYHNGSLGSDVDNWRKLGENVGKGPTARAIHDAFMASSSHRAHILDRAYDQIGIGTVTKNDVIYVTEVFADRSTATKPVVRRVVRKTVAPRPVVRRAKVVERAPPPPPAPLPQPQVVSMLLTLAGLDAEVVDPRTGVALAQPIIVTLRQTPR